jgi:hypothetical protein
MGLMDRFDDVSVVASVDESPPRPRMARRTRRASMVVVASIVAASALAGATVGLADEKTEPSKAAAPAAQTLPVSKSPGHVCHRGDRGQHSAGSSAPRY